MAEDVVMNLTLHVDGSSSSKGSKVGLIFENEEGVVVEVSITFSFSTSNNQARYEAWRNLKYEVDLHFDSLLVVS